MMRKTILGLLVLALLAWGIAIRRSLAFFLPETPRAASTKSTDTTTVPAPRPLVVRDLFLAPTSSEAPPPRRPESRSPKPVRPVDSVAQVPPPFRLLGIVDGTPPLAILSDGTRSELVPVGKEAFGWTLAKASRDRAILRKGGRTLELVQ